MAYLLFGFAIGFIDLFWAFILLLMIVLLVIENEIDLGSRLQRRLTALFKFEKKELKKDEEILKRQEKRLDREVDALRKDVNMLKRLVASVKKDLRGGS